MTNDNIMESQEITEATIENLKNRALAKKTTSDRYRMIETSTVRKTVAEVLDSNNIEHTVKVVRQPERKSKREGEVGCGSTKHAVQFHFTQPVKVFGEEINPKIIIMNSFQGETALRTYVGFYNAVCMNGMISGDDIFKERIVHLQGQTAETKIAALKESIEAAVIFIQTQFANKMEETLSRSLTQAQKLQVIDNISQSARWKKACKDLVVNPVHEKDKADNVYALFNVINEGQRNRGRVQDDVSEEDVRSTGFKSFADIEKNIGLMDRILKSVDEVLAA